VSLALLTLVVLPSGFVILQTLSIRLVGPNRVTTSRAELFGLNCTLNSTSSPPCTILSVGTIEDSVNARHSEITVAPSLDTVSSSLVFNVDLQ
jgi:hypothetical protein